ncbi:MAG: glycoside hydrolase family 95 protein [Lachnospiraceae bacterium]|nr:glycoside hydrolase family 95 protein [Lachnospiraceae bacterium]
MKLWYEQPAQKWSEALPIGNGTLGGMVFGGVKRERIQLNEETIWGGRFLDRHNPNAKENLPKIRELLQAGKIAQAEQLAVYALSGTPHSQRPYLTAGDLHLNFVHGEHAFTEYKRTLNLAEGIATVAYQIRKTKFTREIFSSFPAGVLVIRLQAEGEEKLNFDCHLDRLHNWSNETKAVGNDTIVLYGDTGEDAVLFSTGLKCKSDGHIEVIGNHLVVQGASHATLCLKITTSFRHSKNYVDAMQNGLNACMALSYSDIKKGHLMDYQELFHRVEINLGNNKALEDIPTDLRLKKLAEDKTYEDPALFALYYQYGRYLLISSSRAGSLPINLQGIWNDSLTPSWDSKYTININTEMNYWPAGSARLTECEQPFFDHLKRMKENGKKTAEVMYGCRGSVAHHNTDIYADTAPQDIYIPATYWVLGQAWMATHIWNHFLFTKNKQFLEEHFDILEQNVLFFQDFLIGNEKGELIISPSVSPENTYILPNGEKGCLCEGCISDAQILRELLLGYIGACEVLSVGEDNIKRAKVLMDKLPKNKIGKQGQLLEWLEEYEEEEPGHRHISHLYGVYPGTTISWEQTPDFMMAARKTLERRLAHGGGHTGWSRAWIIIFWAKFLAGDMAYDNFKALLTDSTFPNMMDNHPLENGFVFQIDGNLGATAGLAEMLVQESETSIHLLPALPKAWNTGEVKGLGLKGQGILNMKWQDGKILHYEILGGNQEKEIRINEKASV